MEALLPEFVREVQRVDREMPPGAVPLQAFSTPREYAERLVEAASRGEPLAPPDSRLWEFLRAALRLPTLAERQRDFAAQLAEPAAAPAREVPAFDRPRFLEEHAVAVLQDPALPLGVDNEPIAVGADVVHAWPRVLKAATRARSFRDRAGARYVQLHSEAPESVLLVRALGAPLPTLGEVVELQSGVEGAPVRRAAIANVLYGPKSYNRKRTRSEPRAVVAQLEWL
jgi:hypothetical protein